MTVCCCADPDCMANGCRRSRQEMAAGQGQNSGVLRYEFVVSWPVPGEAKAEKLYEFSRLDLEKTLRVLYPRHFDGTSMAHYPVEGLKDLMVRATTAWRHLPDTEKELYRLRAKELS